MPASDLGAWVKEHNVCWELAPLREGVKGHGVEQTGYELDLFARFDLAAQDDDDAVARTLHEGLRALALDVLRCLPAQTEVQLEPFSRQVWPSGAGSTIEVELTVVVSPPPSDPSQPPAEPRRAAAALERSLRSMGLPKRT